jgi:hypothetical protein
MADEEHLELIRQGVQVWNDWRAKEPSVRPDLHRASLSGADLHGADLMGEDLMGAYLFEANLLGAILSGADLFEANLLGADLSGATLGRAHLTQANLRGADLEGANLTRANLSKADLSGVTGAALAETNLENADLTGCRIYGISAWNVKLSQGTKQENLIITAWDEPEVTADDIEVAQFLYHMMHNDKIRRVIDTITSKVVLILGRFTPERKVVLDALREELRRRNYVPVLFDFEKPKNRTTDETITLLAHMARFIIADITDAKSVLHELRAIVPDVPTVPAQPVIVATQKESGMFDFFRRFPWVLECHHYDCQERLIAELGELVINPAEAKVLELRRSS